jgi:Beta-lactamase
VLHPWGLLRLRDLGETVPFGEPVPSLDRFYGSELRLDAEPGTRWVYTNHGFATLGQIVADITGVPLAQYLRNYILDPLGMEHTDLERSDRVKAGLAIAYELRSRGAVPVDDYEVVPAGAGALYSTPRDISRYLAALLGGGANQYGSVLKPETLACMFAPHYQPDPRVPGMGLAFFRGDLGGHVVVEHDGILPGFDAQIMLAPEDGVAVMAFANGAKRGMHWLTPEVTAVTRQILRVPDAGVRADVPHHPEIWNDLRGWYRFSAHRTDPARFAIGAGVEVFVRRGLPWIRFLVPVPALYQGFLLHPDDPDDPYVFRIELPWLGIGTCRVLFGNTPDGVTGLHLEFGPLSFDKRPAATNPRRWAIGALATVGVATGAAAVRRRRRNGVTP